MKKLFIALAAVALTACVKAPEKTVKVYAWQGEGENTTEQTLQAVSYTHLTLPTKA